MSFILDALKKSENDRQRQTGPALFEVKVAPPKARFPLWGIALGVLLGANLIVLLVWLAMRGATNDAVPAGAATQVAAAAPGAVPAAAATPSIANTSPPPGATPTASTTETPYGDSLSANGASRADPMLADEADDSELNAADYEPAIEPEALPREPPAAASGNTRVSPGLPTREEAIARGVGDIPELRLDMHVYAANSAQRFVLINMQRMREGDALPNGVRVERITEDGAEMSWRGNRFLLEQE